MKKLYTQALLIHVSTVGENSNIGITTFHQIKCSNKVDEQMQKNYKDDGDDQKVPSMLCVRKEIELVHEMYADN